jgi:hypothetical protein
MAVGEIAKFLESFGVAGIVQLVAIVVLGVYLHIMLGHKIDMAVGKLDRYI